MGILNGCNYDGIMPILCLLFSPFILFLPSDFRIFSIIVTDVIVIAMIYRFVFLFLEIPLVT
jgi:hypothetical protein